MWNRGFWIVVVIGLMPIANMAAQDVASPGKSSSSEPRSRRREATMVPGQPMPPGHPGGMPVAQPAGGAPNTGKPAEPPKTDAGPKLTTRSSTPPVPPNREEFKVRPDKDGKIRFNFQGQPWADVLAWLATISNLSLDWQEMPSDYLNLKTHRSYTLDEARDLINRHLLDRGFTLLKHGEILSVVNVKKGLDPSLVPRVKPEDLDKHMDHEFVKVSFSLNTLNADSAHEELKPMLSPNGKLSPLRKTNRLEAIDAVVNLLEIRSMLGTEQSQRGREQLVREFKLINVRAADVRPLLQEFLGLEKTLDPSTAGAGVQNQQQQQMMMQQRMMQGQQPGQPGQPGAGKPPLPAVRLVVNTRENSILADAPADQMAKIVEFVRLYDIPSTRARGEGLAHVINRTRVYRLASLDPEPLVKMLQEVGDLDPLTKLNIDKKSRAIIVDAPLVDHMTIATLLKKLDATDRRFEVVKLRRLEADYVAGSIEFMMGGGEKKKNNRPSYFDFYGFGGGRNDSEDDSKKFRVDADVEHNRLLMWANDVELEEVNRLLVKLGELPGGAGLGGRTRVLDTVTPEESRDLLERLRRVWPSIGNNPLEIDARLVPDAVRPDASATPPAKKTPGKPVAPD
jgi:hypothetical protein